MRTDPDNGSSRLWLGAGLALALALLLVAGGLFAGSASAARYVAMGDSYSAGTGLDESDHNWGTGSADVDCHRSPKAYGPLIRAALGATSSSRGSRCCARPVSSATREIAPARADQPAPAPASRLRRGRRTARGRLSLIVA